jgi:glycosyltransferase involved in cell wall biosynthesis
MKVWIVQTAEPLQIDEDGFRPMRAMNLSEALVDAGHEVTILSSDFNHYTKKHRFGKNVDVEVSKSVAIKLFTSKGYTGHKGVSRFLDHVQMALNLRRILKDIETPDVAFLGFPPIETTWIVSRWLKKHRVPYVVDIKDEWPDIILREVPRWLKSVFKILLFPYFYMTRKAFANADCICSVTEDFLDWSLSAGKRERNQLDFVLPTTSRDLIFTEKENKESEKFWDLLGVYDDGKNRAYFVGTINHVYNFEPVIYAAMNSDIQFVIAGNGPQLGELVEKYSNCRNLVFPGWITASQSLTLSRRSKIALAPFAERSDFDMNITNKFYDALRLGKPMMTSTKGVAGKMLLSRDTGRVYHVEDSTSLLVQLNELLSKPEVLHRVSANARDLYESDFDAVLVYKRAVNVLEILASKER